MKDVGLKLREVYFSTLNGNITDVDGNNVPVYDRVPHNPGSKYLYFSDFEDNDSPSDKDDYNHNTTVTLVASVKFDGDHGGQKEADNIIDQVLQRIIKKSGKPDLSPDFNLVTARLDQTNRLPVQEVEGGMIFSRSAKIRHIICE